jgi:hypothetical protein
LSAATEAGAAICKGGGEIMGKGGGTRREISRPPSTTTRINGADRHNIAYARGSSSPRRRITQALALVGSGYKPDRQDLASPKPGTSCLACHAGIEEITKPIFGLIFPHKNHVAVQNLSCSTCHSNARKHGRLVATASAPYAITKDVKKDWRLSHPSKSLYAEGPFRG